MRRVLLITAGSLSCLVLLIALYLAFADLSGYRDMFARHLSEETGIDLVLGGRFEPRPLSLTPGLVLGSLSIADPAGATSPFIHVEDVEVEVSLGALLMGKIHARELRFSRATVRLIERDGAPSSWEIGGDTASGNQASRRNASDFPVRLEHAVMDRIDVIYESPDRDSPVVLTVDRLVVGPEPGERLPLKAEARIGDSQLLLAGTIPRLGRLAYEGRDLEVDLHGTLGEASVSIEGTMEDLHSLSGPDMDAMLEGDDLESLTGALGLPSVGGGSFFLSASIEPVRDGLGVSIEAGTGAESSATRHRFEAAGLLDSPTGRLEVGFEAAGADLASFSPAAGLNMPRGPYWISGRLLQSEDGLMIEQAEVDAAGILVKAGGTLGTPPDLTGIDLEIEASGPALKTLEPLAGVPLPEGSFDGRGRLIVTGSAVEIQGIRIDLDGHSVEGSVLFDRASFPDGTRIEAAAEGPDLSDAARRFALEGFPGEPYDARATLEADRGRIDLQQLVADIGRIALELDGEVGLDPGLDGTDLGIQVSGPSPTALDGWLELPPLPEDRFTMSGQLQRNRGQYRLDDVVLELGPDRLTARGSLGPSLNWWEADLGLTIEGPDLSRFGSMLAAIPFSASARLDGSRTDLSMTDLEATVGDGDLSGTLTLETDERAHLSGTLHSDHLRLTPWLKADEAEHEGPEPEGAKNAPVIPDTPIPVESLRMMDVDLEWTADSMDMIQGNVHDVRARITLDDGTLQVSDLSARGTAGGSIHGSASLERRDQVWLLDADLSIEGVKLGLLAASEDPEHQSPVDLEAEISGDGESLHAIAAGADGRLLVVQGEGRVDFSILDTLGADLLAKIFDALNPFNEKLPYTELECAVLLAELEDGELDFDALAMRTDKVTVIGSGRIEMESESIDLEWTSKPRRGIGLSLGGITNPYVKVGGTLSDPGLTVKPLNAVLSTGAAVFTGGLSFLAKGVWDRITAERNVCQDALEDAREQLTETRSRIEEARRERAAPDG